MGRAAQVYFDALEAAAAERGVDGVKLQAIYLATNLVPRTAAQSEARQKIMAIGKGAVPGKQQRLPGSNATGQSRLPL
jgi:hypothetical protein